MVLKKHKISKNFLSIALMIFATILFMGMVIAVTGETNETNSDLIGDVNTTDSVDHYAVNSTDTVIMHFFWDATCPHCMNQKTYNARLQEEVPQLIIKSYQPFVSQADRVVYFELADKLDIEPSGVPMTIIDDEVWVGFAPYLYSEMQDKIKSMLDETQSISEENSNMVETGVVNTTEVDKKNSDNILEIPYIGAIDLNKTPLFAATIMIAIMDGFNPCSLWLLLFLIGILVLTKSRKKMLIVGLTFLLVTAIAYGLFISGLFSVFAYVQHINLIAYVVGLIAFIFAVVNTKDYFYYKKGISFTISDKKKPGLFSKMRNILRPDNSLAQMVGATAILALGVTLVELPCTAGLPLIWSNLVAAQGVSTLGFIGLLLVYLLLYLGIEIIILIGAIITMNKFDFREKHGRILKLVSGIIMLVFAYAFVFNYDMMNSLEGMFKIMLIATILILLVLIAHRRILPYYNINIGNENLSYKKKQKFDDGSARLKTKKSKRSASHKNKNNIRNVNVKTEDKKSKNTKKKI